MKKLLLSLSFLLLGAGIAALGQVPQTGAGVGAPGGGGGGGGCTQSASFLSGLSTTWTSAYQTMICGMVTDGTYSSFDRLYILATDNSTNALKDIISNAAASISGTATFTANSGYVSNGTNGTLNTGLNYSTATHFKQNSGLLMAWTTGLSGGTHDNGCPLGEASGGFDMWMQVYQSSGQMGGDIMGVAIAAGTAGTGVGMFAVDYNGTAAINYFNGSANGSTTAASSAPANTTAQGFQCASTTFFSHNVAMLGVGSSLGATNETNVYNRVHTFLHTVNAGLFP